MNWWKTNTHVKSTFHLIHSFVCVCIELVIVCSFIFDNFFFSFRSFFLSIFVGGLIRLHQLSYCRNCFSVLWLINTHWPYVQIEYNKMYRYLNRKSTYMCINYTCTNTLHSFRFICIDKYICCCRCRCHRTSYSLQFYTSFHIGNWWAHHHTYTPSNTYMLILTRCV